MADNVAITAGSGTTVAADEVVDGTLGTVKVQYVKIMDGTLDSTTKAAVGANGLKVDGSAVTQPVSGTVTAAQATAASLNATVVGTGTFAVQAAQSGTWTVQPGNTANTTPWLAKISDGTNSAAIKAASTAPAATDPAMVVAISPNSVNANGQATMANSAPVVIASNQSAVPITQGITATANGGTASRINAAATTNATSLKASGGQVYGIDVFNVAAYNVFLKLYNKASAPTVGTDTPFMTIPVAAGGGVSLRWTMGLPMGTGIAYAITKLQADSDTTAVTAGDLTGLTLWI